MAALVHIGVKAGQGNPPDARVGTVGPEGVDDLGFGLLVLKLDLVAHDGDDLELGGIWRRGGKHLEADGGAFFAADAFDHAVELHVDDVFEFLVVLRDGSNAVVDLEFAAAVGGSTGDEFDNLGVAIVAPEHGPDADKREAHLDVEIIQGPLAHVFGVGVVALGERGKEGGGLVLAVFLLQRLEQALVAFAHGLNRGAFRRGGGSFGGFLGLGFFVGSFLASLGCSFFKGLVGDDGLEELGFEPVGPDFVRLGLAHRPREFVAVDLRGAVAVKGKVPLESFPDPAYACLDTRDKAVVNVISRLEISGEDILVDPFAMLRGEFVDVGLGEEKAVVVEQLEVTVEGFAGLGNAWLNFVVEALAAEVRTLEHSSHRLGDFAQPVPVFLRFVGMGGSEGGERGGEG